MTHIFAHRGSSIKYPENTMLAFKHALKDGADGIELDVQLSKDQVPVIIHDETVDRTTNGHGFVKDHTLKQLKSLHAGKKRGMLRFSQEQIPTLEEFLRWIKPTKLLLNIELKNSLIEYQDIELLTINLVHKYDMMSRTFFSSFNHDSLMTLKKIDPSTETAILYKGRLRDIARYAKAIQANGIHPNYKRVTKAFINDMHQHDLVVRPYTVNYPRVMKRLINWEIDGFFTDNPKLAYRIRREIYKNNDHL